MSVYSSLARFKQQRNGTLPPMTPVTGAALEIIDPDFTIGLGALAEDGAKGLRCPVRGCGVYRHRLRKHLNTVHAGLGGADAVLRALSIPDDTSLLSGAEEDRMRKNGDSPASRSALARGREVILARGLRKARDRRRRGAKLRTKNATMAKRNMLQRCDAQVEKELIDLKNKIGRTPSRAEAEALCSAGFVTFVVRTYGSWNAGKARFGIDCLPSGGKSVSHWRSRGRRRWERDAVVEALSSYYDHHATLPMIKHAINPTVFPVVPSPTTIVRALGAQSWTHAMQIAASLLGIHGGRFGLRTKITSMDADSIRMRQSRGETYTALAKEFGVTRATIWRVIRGVGNSRRAMESVICGAHANTEKAS